LEAQVVTVVTMAMTLAKVLAVTESKGQKMHLPQKPMLLAPVPFWISSPVSTRPI
jgi:hypothetical protein